MKGVGVTDHKQTFTHIGIHDGSDDDIVIQAGAPVVSSKASDEVCDPASAVADYDAPDLSGDEDAYDEEASDVEEASDDEVLYEDEDLSYESSYSEVPESEQASSASSKKKDTYHETTLEDLEDISMSSTQKVVIGVVLTIIVVAVVYFAFFMK